MPVTPEQKARERIDGMLNAAGWIVQDRADANIDAARGVAIREFSLGRFGEADYLLFVDGQAAGVVEAKKEGSTLVGVEIQTQKYSEGIPDALPAPRRPLPFCYQSTGVETRFTNLLEPDASSRQVFSFHTPATLAQWLADDLASPGSAPKARLLSMPPLIEAGLRPAQIEAVRSLEESMRQGRRRALIQMATGAGKTYTACNFIYRLIKFTGARRVLFLVDRANLGRQALKEFQAFRTADDGRIFTELYNVQRLQSNRIDSVAKVCISTIQRLFSMLKGEEMDSELDEVSGASLEMLQRPPEPITYNPAIPIETFDIIVTDECHRSIYNLWRQVLEYFDASLIGLTATPSKQTMGYNTGIATYIWVLTNRKPANRRGKVQLIDATGWSQPLRKNLGKKNCELAEADMQRVMDAFLKFEETEQSKIFPNEAFGYWKIVVERPLRLNVEFTKDRVAHFRAACAEAKELPLANLLDRVAAQVGVGPQLNFNVFSEAVESTAEKDNVKLTPKRWKLIQTALAVKDEAAEPVIKKLHKPGKAEVEPLYGRYAVTVNGKPHVAEYEPDSELRDTEQVPLLAEGGIEAFVKREVLPHVRDAWVAEDATKIGYEISFTRYFYKPQPLRTLDEIKADIEAIERETEGLLDQILVNKG